MPQLTTGTVVRYTRHMPKKPRPAKDKELTDLLKAGGRKGAEADFDAILKKAVQPQRKKPQPKPKA